MGYARESAAVAPLNGRTHELKSTRSARGRKPVPTEELEKKLRRAGKAFVEELFPSREPDGFEIDHRSGKWRFAPAKRWSRGRFNLWQRERGTTIVEAARQIEEWLAGKEELENAKPEPQPASPNSLRRSPKIVDNVDIKNTFAEFARSHGLVEPKGGFIADGKLRRCHVAASLKDKRDAASYQLFSEGVPGGWVQNWTNGAGPQTWSLRIEDAL